MAQMEIIRPVEILVGIRALCAFLKVSAEKIREMESRGAPVIRDASGVMRAEKAELWDWLKAESAPNRLH